MTEYYLCDINIAKAQCSGLSFLPVHYDLQVIRTSTLHYDWRLSSLPAGNSQAVNVALLKDVDNSMQTMLALADPLFRIAHTNEMSGTLLHYIKYSAWQTL